MIIVLSVIVGALLHAVLTTSLLGQVRDRLGAELANWLAFAIVAGVTVGLGIAQFIFH